MKLRLAALAAATAIAIAPLASQPTASVAAEPTVELKVASFNASLNRDEEGQLKSDLATPDNEQAKNVAETIQRANPDVVLVNEFDFDPEYTSAVRFRDNYLKVSQNGADPVNYPYMWAGPVNTGVPSGFDLNNDGKLDTADDALGFGKFPGQYGFVVYSKYPIDYTTVRTFQNFKWKDMPGALLPENEDGTPWYSNEELEALPLSSKTHADIPVTVDGTTVHVLAAHPTPPSFDGPEKRNQKRNHDEIRIWADYISQQADYLYDDKGETGGLPEGENFVIVGDYNADALDGDSWDGAINQLLESPLVLDPKPTSAGAAEAAELQGGANADHKADPALDTADFNDNPQPGNLRVDYVLANSTATALDAAVFWPTRDSELVRLTGEYPFPTSDHRLVWAKFAFPAAAEDTPAPGETPGETDAPAPAPAPGETPGESPAPTPGDTQAPAEPTEPAQTDASATPGDKQDSAGGLATTGADTLLPMALVAAGLLGAGVLVAWRTYRRAEHE